MVLHWSDVKELLRTLKQAVIDDPVLQLPDHTKPFEVHTRMRQTMPSVVC
jgi:hypothetical protein